MPMDLWKAAMLDSGGYFGIRGEHIDAVAREIEKIEHDEIDTDDFIAACERAGVDPSNFGSEDLEKLQEYLNR